MATTTYVTEIVIRDVKKTQVTEYTYGQHPEFKGQQVSAVIGMESVVEESCVAR